MFGISHRDPLGSLCSFHLSFCESISPFLCESFSFFLCESFSYLLCKSFICIVIFFYYSEFAILVGIPMPEFLRSYEIVSGGAPNCLNFDVRPLHYCNSHLWLVTFLAEL
ncbi:hypothetical protein ACE6H2_015152 [Prunus campanulata]